MPGSRRRRLARVSARSLRGLQKVFPSRRELKPKPSPAAAAVARPEAANRKPEPAAALAKALGSELRLHPGAPRAAAERLELAQARRRLLEVESQRRALGELERRVRQLHLVFVQTEVQVAGQGEGLGQAEVYLGVHAQRLKTSLRRRKKSCALGGCAPWGRRARRRSASAPPAAVEASSSRRTAVQVWSDA
uniref:TMF-regulated nuclear protein 1 isoform X2 n=1 Tax=Geotrypetes seraphini TaxID=260995 RepID=A0A6P8RW98_GEOSA|nr:TMF-regulated nuclear protein 1 isoform X2 [Geotrypetes seraphini]